MFCCQVSVSLRFDSEQENQNGGIKMHLEEKTVNSESIYKGRIFEVTKDTALLENGKEALHRYLVEVIIKIADYIFSDSEKTKKGVDRAMGGEVLELKTDKLINEIRQDVKEEVKAEVKEEVKTETKEKIVICMLKRGKSTLEEIAADTQMPIEQVERIKKEQQL